MNYSRTATKGFTLVELLVVLGLFTAVITIASGALFSAQAVNTKLQHTQTILDGVNLAMEQMIREVRYGTSFYCAASVPGSIPSRQDCAYPNGRSVLMFKPAAALTGTNSANDRVAYYLSSGALYRQTFPEGIAGAPVRITASDVIIEQLLFYVKGSGSSSSGDHIQPLATISISGVTDPVEERVTPVEFTLQTSSAVREIDN